MAAPQGYGTPLAPGVPAPLSPSDERLWAMLAHLAGFVVSIVGPLVIYLIYKDRGPFVRRHSAEALNFQISVMIYAIVSVILVFVVTVVTLGFGAFVAVPLLIAAMVAAYVFMVLAAMAANRGQDYRYPLTIRFVS